MLAQHGIGEEEAGRFHIGDEQRALVAGGDVAGEHHADLVGEDRLALIVDHAAAVAVAVEGKTEIGACAASTASRVASSMARSSGFGLCAGKV